MMEESTGSLLSPRPAQVPGQVVDEEVKVYKIHVSSKYLELTRKKLELTRLPHELAGPAGEEGGGEGGVGVGDGGREQGRWDLGTKKSEVEPLIDFWLEQYSWRTRESYYNTSLPQFRTSISISISISSSPTPLSLRIHFIHIISPHRSAIPLLLIPSFPLTNLSLSPLFNHLTNPDNPSTQQPFHLVVPSIPGLGFSDAFSINENLLSHTAEIFNELMKRLGYEYYFASSTGSGEDSPAGIDHYLARELGETWNENCLGVHLLGPRLAEPRPFGGALWAWMRWKTAEFFHAEVWGYTGEDFRRVKEVKIARGRERERKSWWRRERCDNRAAALGTAGMLGLREPNTIAYAFCDSPVGLLSLACSALKSRNPNHRLTDEEIIDVTQLAWLPGPEAGMRLFTAAVKEVEGLEKKEAVKSRVAITVFAGEDGRYSCPGWGNTRHEVVFAQRVEGKAGLVAWERVEDVITGIRGLASAIVGLDERLKVEPLEEVVVAPASGHAIPEEEDDEQDGAGMQLDVESPNTDHTVTANEMR